MMLVQTVVAMLPWQKASPPSCAENAFQLLSDSPAIQAVIGDKH